ncbi:MAG: hypothetical protein IPH44_20030 [Myxococcales bacterium]|nr:hypothetical protein [Myxococcales bacterium]
MPNDLSIAETLTPESELRAAAGELILEALAPVAQSLQEFRLNVQDRLEELGAKDWLAATRETLEPYIGDLKIGELVRTAIAGLEWGIDLVAGKVDASLKDVVVSLVAFGLQVADYVRNGHFLGDLQKAGLKVAAGMRQLRLPAAKG